MRYFSKDRPFEVDIDVPSKSGTNLPRFSFPKPGGAKLVPESALRSACDATGLLAWKAKVRMQFGRQNLPNKFWNFINICDFWSPNTDQKYYMCKTKRAKPRSRGTKLKSGMVLGCLRDVLGRLWGVLCASGGLLGSSWGVLGASWNV